MHESGLRACFPPCTYGSCVHMIKLVEVLLNLAISLAMLSCASLVWLRLIWMNSMVSMVLVMEGGYVARTGMSHLFSVCCLGF